MINIFPKKQDIRVFKSAQEAYSYLFVKLQSEGIDIEIASERAYKFSTEYAERMSLPVSIAPDEKGFKGILQKVKMASDFAKENPTIVEFGKPIVINALSALFGAFAGVKIAENNDEKPVESAPIEYDND